VKPRRPRGACRQGYHLSIQQPTFKSHFSAGLGGARAAYNDPNSETDLSQKPEPKCSSAPKPADGKFKKKAAASVKTASAILKILNLVVPTQSPTSTLEEISDPLDHFSLSACVELIRRLLKSISFFPTGAARPRAVLKTVIIFVVKYGSTPYEVRVV